MMTVSMLITPFADICSLSNSVFRLTFVGRPATCPQNHPARELRTNMVGGTKIPGWSYRNNGVLNLGKSMHVLEWSSPSDAHDYHLGVMLN
jgi:hypothetical protein